MLPLLIGLALFATPPLTPAPANLEQRPAIFTELGFEEARKAAADEGKLLVLDAMTSWCGPCKQMDHTTWIDPELVTWMRTNTVAIQLDMDEHEALKRDLRITAFPTIITFDAEGEADRIVGYRDAEAMGEWLKLVARGGTELEKMLAEIAAREWTDSKSDLQARARYASELIYLAGYAEATGMLIGIWNAAPAAGFERAYLRTSFSDLARADANSRERIERLRAALTPTDPTQLADWVNLGVALGDDTGLDAWVLGQNARGQGAATRRFSGILYPTLLRARHFRSAGICLDDPIGRFERDGANLAKFDAYDAAQPAAMGMTLATPIDADAGDASAPTDEPAEPVPTPAPKDGAKPTKKTASIMMMPMVGAEAKATSDSNQAGVMIRAQYRWDASNAYAALLAAGRTDEAVAVADTVLRYEDSPKARIALVARALEAGQAAARLTKHVAWLDEASSAPTEDL
jgi:thiol-disulfide isomerase/thioredoxin